MPPLELPVELTLDQRSATSVANDAQQAMTEAGRKISREFSQTMSGATVSTKALGSELDGVRGRAVSLSNQVISLGGHLADVDRTTVGLAQRGVSAFGGMSTAAAATGLGVAGIGTAAVVALKQLYDLGAQWDDIADGITVRTGKVGDQLTSLTNAVGDIGSSTAASLGTIGDVVGQISQAMPGLAANNGALRQMGSNLAYLDANGQSVNIRELGMAFNAFGVSTTGAVSGLDDLNRVSQATGIPINELIATVRQGAPQFKEFGLDLGQATGLLASFSRAGLDPGATVTGLRTALKSVGQDARGAAPALADVVTQIKSLSDAGQAGSAQKLAIDTFGARNFAPFLDAIKEGTLNAESLKTALDNVGLSVADLQDATDDGAQGFQKLGNTIKTEAAPWANKFFTFVNNEVLYLTGHLTEATNQLKELASTPITPDSALGRMLLPGGGLPGMPGVSAPNGIGSGSATGGLLSPRWGSDSVAGVPFGKSAAAGKLPDAPVLPVDTTLPPGFSSMPQTAELYSAESSFIDARHAAAEKQARLNQLEQDNNAKAEDVQAARNDAIQAQRSASEAELRLYDTANKKLKDQTSQMEQFGAQIDNDFGVSKGLPGIAENITKFLANLAMAPVLGALEAVKKSEGFDKDSGSGLLGFMGNSGAFGSQFTPAGRAATSGSTAAAPYVLGPNGVTPGASTGAGGPVGTAAPGESARDFAHRVMMPFFQNEGFTVGDHGADKYGEHQNGALDIMVPSIAEGSKVLQQVLSDPNVYGAIFNNQTYGYGHGTTPQDYSAGHTGDPSQDHTNHVHAFYKPGGSDNITPLTGGGGPVGSVSTPVPVTIVGGGAGVGGGGGAGGLSPEQWNNIAGAEASGNWGINSGNGFSGGLQFSPSSWAAAGGTKSAPEAWQASPEQQMAAGNNLLAMQGPGAWPATSAAHPDWFQPGAGPSGAANFVGGAGGGLGGGSGSGWAGQGASLYNGFGSGAYDPNAFGSPSGAGRFNPGMQIDTSTASSTGPQAMNGGRGPRSGEGVDGSVGMGPNGTPLGIVGSDWRAGGGAGGGVPNAGAGDLINAIPGMAGGPGGPAGLNGVPSGQLGGGARTGGPGGAGRPGGTGNRGAAPSASVAGGRQFGQGLPASGGISFNGGIIGAAASMAAGAAGGAASMGAGGGAASAAADIGMQLIGRAVGAGGQYIGNAVGGLMETFALNDSALGDPGKSWLGRLAIAGAGMRPALPNSAGALGGEQNKAMAEGGKPPPGPLTPEQAEANKANGVGGAAGKQGDTFNNNVQVTNNRPKEDGTGRDIQAALGATQGAKQPR